MLAEQSRASSSTTGEGAINLNVPIPLPQPARQPRPRVSHDPKNYLAPSSLQPLVLASDRTIPWQTPYSIQHRQLLLTRFLADHIERFQSVCASAVVRCTREGWRAGLLRFNQYCDSINIPEEEHMPAPQILLGMFIANCGASKVSESCITTWIAGLHRYHQIHDAPWLGGDIVTLVKKGVAAQVPIEATRNPRAPITITHITALHTHLDHSNSFDSAVFAVACIAFWGCCRLGELTIPSHNIFDPTFHVARSTTVRNGAAREGRMFVTFHIPYSKMRKHRGDDIQLIDINDPTNPISAFTSHLRHNSNIPDNAPLFAFRMADYNWAPMTKPWFLERCNEIWT
jgi:hypothetical protein